MWSSDLKKFRSSDARRISGGALSEVRDPRMSDISFVSNKCGHDLAVRRVAAAPSGKGARPVVIVPGYGMNSFIFGFHPQERSLEATLAHRGLVVYAADLRGQGRSRRN